MYRETVHFLNYTSILFFSYIFIVLSSNLNCQRADVRILVDEKFAKKFAIGSSLSRNACFFSLFFYKTHLSHCRTSSFALSPTITEYVSVYFNQPLPTNVI